MKKYEHDEGKPVSRKAAGFMYATMILGTLVWVMVAASFVIRYWPQIKASMMGATL